MKRELARLRDQAGYVTASSAVAIFDVRSAIAAGVICAEELTKMGNTADTGNDPAALELLPSGGAENSSDPAALPAAEKAIDAEIT